MLRGQLIDFPLTEVARLLCATSKTGCLVVRSGSGLSSLFLNLGQIQSAVHGEYSGLDALEHIAAQIGGEFEFVEGVMADPDTLVTFPTAKLLEVLERIHLEERELAALRPAAHDIPRYLSGRVPSDFEASTEDLSLALSARGNLSVEELAEQSKREMISIMDVLARFRRAGFIEIVGQKEKVLSAPLPPEPVPVVTAPLHLTVPAEPGAVRYWRGRPIR